MDQQEQWRFFYEIFDASLPRLGPGEDQSTLRALRTILAKRGATRESGDGLRVLDIGCGNGPQSLALARALEGTIVAVDNHQPFLDELERRAHAENLVASIETRLKDMNDLGDEDGLFDLVWAEGSLFITGFREGLHICFDRLVPGGFAAVSELAWLRPDCPVECREFFTAGYPALTDLPTNERTVAESGFELLEHFAVSDTAWWNPFYTPLSERVHLIRTRYPEDAERLAMLAGIETEIEIRRKYSEFYGNVFFLMRKPAD